MQASHKEPTWSDAIEQAIVQLGYIATLKQIYEVAPKLKNFKGVTPHKTINERVQRDPRFYKLKPGLYGLSAHLDKIPEEYNPKVRKTIEQESSALHSYMQGLLIEIGNLIGRKTFSPNKTGKFLNKTLDEIATQKEIPPFTFESIIKKSASHIDVIWFNERLFPSYVFEVEHTTDMRDSLIKFVELQDFITQMAIVAPKHKLKKFEVEIKKSAFHSIRNRVKFFDYEYVEHLYSYQLESRKFRRFLSP